MRDQLDLSLPHWNSAGWFFAFSTLFGIGLVLISCACCKAKKSSSKQTNGQSSNGQRVVFSKIGNGVDSSHEAQADGYHKIVDKRSDSLPQPHVSLNHRALPAVPCRQANGVGEGNDLCLTRESSISELYATVDKSVGVPPAVPEKTVVITQFNSTGNQHCYSTIDDYSANNGVKQAVSGKNVSVLQVNESTADKPVGNRPLLVNNIAASESVQLYAPVTKSEAKILKGTTLIVGDVDLQQSEPLYNRIDGEPSISEDPYSSIKGDGSESDPLYSKVGENGTPVDVYGVHRPAQMQNVSLDNSDQSPDTYDPLYCQVDDWPQPKSDAARPSSYVGPALAPISPRGNGISPNPHVYAKIHRRTSSDKQLVDHIVKMPIRCEHEYSVIKKYDTEPNVHTKRNGKNNIRAGGSAGIFRHHTPPMADFDQPTTSRHAIPVSSGYADVPDLANNSNSLSSTTAISEPSYKFITVRESLETLRARIEQTANQNTRVVGSSGSNHINSLQAPTVPESIHHYYSTISEHNYELVNDRQANTSGTNDNSSLLYEQLPYEDGNPIAHSSSLDDSNSLQYMDYYATPSHSASKLISNATGNNTNINLMKSVALDNRIVNLTREQQADRHYSGIDQPVPIFRPVFEESDSSAPLDASTSPKTIISSHEVGTPYESSSPSQSHPVKSKTVGISISTKTQPTRHGADSGYLPSESSNSESFFSHSHSSKSGKSSGNGECDEELDCFCHGRQRQYYL